MRVALHGQLRGFESSSTHKRPKHMYRNGRPIDNKFKPTDHLYHRCRKDDVFEDRMLPDRIRSRDPSVNWSKYSKPWDVIFDHPGEGIVRFIVRDLPIELPKSPPEPPKNPKKSIAPIKLHSFFPIHDPIEDNYSHSEIRTFKDGARVTKGSLPELAKKEFRQIMSDRSFVILKPRI
jgi:hypothetical protein